MGIRHQFWAIASVGGRYRSLGAVHCQNATGTDAIRACYRLLKIFGSSANEKLIRHDCNYASTKTEDWWKSISRFHEGQLKDDIAFPFIHTCLFLGAAYDSRHEPEPFFYPVSAYETGISPMNLLWNNQTGFTIIDVTDRNQLRYCFMFPPNRPNTPGMDDEEEEERADKSSRCRPLSADEYAGSKYACGEFGLECDVYVDVDLSQWSLISSDTLRELWPEVPWGTKSNRALCDQPTGSCCDRTTMPTLKELASRKFLQVDSQHIEEALEKAKCIPSLSPHLRQLLNESPDSVKGIELLGAAIEEAKALDLSPFPWIEEEAILQLVENNANLQTIESIDLSCNANISVTTVERLLRLCPNVATLTVVQTPNLPLEALSKVLAAKNEIELYHSDLFRAALESPGRGGRDDTRVATLPNYMAIAETVGQIIFLSINKDIAKQDPLRLNGGGLKWSKLARSSSDMTASQGECEFFGATIPLQDAFLSPSRSGTWFRQLLLFFATNSATNDVRKYRFGHASMGCACALAMNVEDNWRVSPIPPTALKRPRSPKSISEYYGQAGALESVKTGEWTLLITVEDKPPRHWYDRSCKELRYVFLKRDVDDKVVRFSISGFYEHTTGRAPTQETFPWQIPHFSKYPTERGATGKLLLWDGNDHCPLEAAYAAANPCTLADHTIVKQCEADEVEEVLGPLIAKLPEDMTRESALVRVMFF